MITNITVCRYIVETSDHRKFLSYKGFVDYADASNYNFKLFQNESAAREYIALSKNYPPDLDIKIKKIGVTYKI